MMKMQNTTLKYSETVVGSPCSAESVTQYTFGMISSTPTMIARHDAPMCGGFVGGLGCTECLVGWWGYRDAKAAHIFMLVGIAH